MTAAQHTAPFGSWPSPISAEQLARGGVRLGSAQLVDGSVWWSEGITAEGGRSSIFRSTGPSDEPERLLPWPWNARSRVHEYGGTAWLALDEGLVFVNFNDQRIYAVSSDSEPEPLTPIGPEVESAAGPSLRWAAPFVPAGVTSEVWWICEEHSVDEPTVQRYIAAVPLDGSAAADPAKIRRVTPASRFVAHPMPSPDGSRLAWISWEHPQMPWDGTELHLATLVDGVAEEVTTIAGDTTTSVLQPTWLDDQRLLFTSDAGGWWNPQLHDVTTGQDSPVLQAEEEFAGPMWQVTARWMMPLDADHVLVVHGTAVQRLGVLTVSTGEVSDLDLGFTAFAGVDVVAESARTDGASFQLAFVASSPTSFPALHTARLELDPVAVRDVEVLRSSRTDVPDPEVLPNPEPITVPGPHGPVHAIWQGPHLAGHAGTEGERPPLVVRVHGGPTGQSPVVLSLEAAYYTSRGFAVVDVNYGGSTGYGRAYRDRLRGQWGVVDVDDTVAVVDFLVAEGWVDPKRVAIEGGSAGGWTTLACLTRSDRFAAGASSYGVAQLDTMVADTHDFESQYIQGLVGPEDLFPEREPISHVDDLSCPVLLLQGSEDVIVPPQQSEAFRDALAAKGLPHRYLLFEGEQHGFRAAENVITAIESTLSFYGQVFGFDTPGVAKLPLVNAEALHSNGS